MLHARNAQSPEYYLTPDCPIEDGKLEARWGGKGARLMGLDEFGTLAFLRLAKGLNPETGSKLTARLKDNRKDATDICVTVPKSVSILIEVTGDERVKEALWDANEYAMKLVEKKAKVRVRKGGVYKDRESGNITVASFYHGTTRPIVEKRDPSAASFYPNGVEIQLGNSDTSTAHFQSNGVEILARSANDNAATPDPHAHIHNYVVNISYDKVEKQWKAMKRHHFDFGEIEDKFHRRLAKNLRKLGYQIEKNDTAFEVKGVSPKVIDLFSRRQGEIKVEEEKKPYLNEKGNGKFNRAMASAKAQLSQVVRQPKSQTPLSRSDLHRGWVSRLSGRQFGALNDLVGRSRAAKSLSRWHDEIKLHASKLRSFVLLRDADVRGQDREQNHGWTR